MKAPNDFFYIRNKDQDAADLLRRWAIWLGRNPSSPYYTRVSYFLGGVGGGDFSDDEGLLIDRFMADIKARQPHLYRVLRMSYLERKSNRAIAVILKCRHDAVGEMLRLGEARIDEKIHSWREGILSKNT